MVALRPKLRDDAKRLRRHLVHLQALSLQLYPSTTVAWPLSLRMNCFFLARKLHRMILSPHAHGSSDVWFDASPSSGGGESAFSMFLQWPGAGRGFPLYCKEHRASTQR